MLKFIELYTKQTKRLIFLCNNLNNKTCACAWVNDSPHHFTTCSMVQVPPYLSFQRSQGQCPLEPVVHRRSGLVLVHRPRTINGQWLRTCGHPTVVPVLSHFCSQKVLKYITLEICHYNFKDFKY